VSDRKTLLRAIRSQPKCNVLRHAFADFLEDNGEGDRDAATVEFIRASCPVNSRSSVVMPRPAYKWLDANWPRLVPTLLAAAPFGIDPGTGKPQRHYVKGRLVWVRLKFVALSKAYVVVLEFSRGFLLHARMTSKVAANNLWPHVRTDQPLAALHGTMMPELWSADPLV